MKVIDKCIADGAKSYIPKPFDFQKVLDIISSVLKE